MDKTGDLAQEWKNDPAPPRARARARCRGIALLQCWGWGRYLAARGPISPDFPNAICLYQKLMEAIRSFAHPATQNLLFSP